MMRAKIVTWLALSLPYPAARGVRAVCVPAAPTCTTATQCRFFTVKDAEIDSLQSATDCTNANGSSTIAKFGRVGAKPNSMHRYLLHFDLSRIPANATVTAATLGLFVEQTQQPSGVSWNVEVDRLTQPFWVETDAKWPTYDCDATAANTRLWCAAGGDFTTADKATWTASATTTGSQTIDVLALVKTAVSSTGGQLHVLLRATGDDTNDIERWAQVCTCECQTAANGPYLDVTWSAPAPGPTPVWLSFRDETATRLVLSSAPANDPEEKDLAVGDFDNDGHQDIIIVRKRPFSTFGPRNPVLLMNQGGILVDRTSTKLGDTAGPLEPRNARDVFVGDFNGDKAPDLAIANTCEEFPTLYQNKGGRCTNWTGFTRQDGWLPPASGPGSFSVAGKRFCAVAGGDVDNDGDLDLYLSNYVDRCSPGDNNQADPNPTASSDKDVLLINKVSGAGATGQFADESQSPVNRLGQYANVKFGTAAEIRDLRLGAPTNTIDIIKISTKDNPQAGMIAPWNSAGTGVEGGVFLLRNGGTGIFSWNAQADTLHLGSPYMFTTGDLNNDGRPDFYVVDDQQDKVYLATGPTTYRAYTVGSQRTRKFGGNVKMADVDGDGYLDVAVGDVDVEFGCSCTPGQECLQDFQDQAHRTFAVLRNVVATNLCQAGRCAITGETCAANTDCPPLQDPWPVTQDQNFHTQGQGFQMEPHVHDFAFIDLNGDGCLDLFMGLCSGYRLFINTTFPKCQGG
jgi:hypothetical protein